MATPTVVGILGTGDYGRALAKKLLRCGCDVVIGSRDPNSKCLVDIDSDLEQAKVTTIGSVLGNADVEIVILAVHSWNIESCLYPFKDSLLGKIFIDVSNRENINGNDESSAEKLAATFPGLRVVKAFNTLSAYAMESDHFGGSRRVFIAADDIVAREKVSKLCCEMGFESVIYGALKAARELEVYPTRLMIGWGWPSIFTLFVFLFWVISTGIRYAVYYTEHPSVFKAGNLPLRFLNKPVCMTALSLVALSYFPGCLAAFLQMYNGSKYRRFPSWLDLWLKSRKMLGLYALFFSVWHVGISTICMSPGYWRPWFGNTIVNVPSNTTGFSFDYSVMMNLTGEATISVGLLAFLFMILVGLSSLPSVGQILNWKEWRFVQSHLGYITLFLATSHVVIFSLGHWIAYPTYFWYSSTFMCTFLALVTLFMKLVLICPGVSCYVDRIRAGWERRRAYRLVPESIEL